MFESIMKIFKKSKKSEKEDSKNTAKERLHLVLAQDRANISADFLELMKQEIIEVIKKYIDIDEKEIDVRLTNKEGEDGAVGAPALYANIPIITIKNEARKLEGDTNKKDIDKKLNNIENVNDISTVDENIENTENNVDNVQTKNNENEQVESNDKTTINKPKIEEIQTNNDILEINNDNVNEVENEKKNS